MIVVGTVVGDVQFTIAVDEGQVAVTIETTGISCSDGDEVTVIYIMDRSRGIAKNRGGISIQRTTTGCDVTTCEYSIVDI